MAENRELALVLNLVASQFQSELKKSGGMLGEFNKFVSDWKTQLTAASGALFAIAKSTANYGEELLKTSQKIGIKVEALAGLQHAANLADLSNESLATGLKKLSVNMVDAARQTGDGEALFRRLGVSATDAAGQLRPTEQVLLDLADVFANSKDGAGKAEAAVKLFGKAGLDLIPFLNQGKAGIKELMAEAERLGLVMSQQDAEAANRFNDELKKLTAHMRGITLAVGTELIPPMMELMRVMGELGGGHAASALSLFMKAMVFQTESWAISIKLAGQQLALLGGNITDVFSPEKARALGAQMDALAGIAEEKRIGAAGRISGVIPPGSSSASPKNEIAVLADQEKLGKALLEIYLANNRAIDIGNKLRTEGADQYFLKLDREIQEEQNEEDRQQHLGKMIVEQTGLEVKIREDALAKERDGLIANSQAWVDYYDQLGGSNAGFYQAKTDLLRAQLAKELDLTKAQAADLLDAWQQHDSRRAEQILAASPKGLTSVQKETAELNAVRQDKLNQRATSDDFFGGWAEGMRKYVKDTSSGFGMAADMARRTAQTMEQGFQSFFFDAMTGKIQTFKDALRSLLNFAQQIVSQIAAQLVTRQVVGAFAGMEGFFAGQAQEGLGRGIVQGTQQQLLGQDIVNNAIANGGTYVRPMATGGIVTRPTYALVGEAGPEAVIPLSRYNQSQGVGGGVSVIINNYGSAPVESAQSGGRGPDGRQMIYVTIRDAVKKAFGEGAMDKTMASRYRMIPQAGG